MALDITDNNIRLTRGDTAYIDLAVIDKDTKEPYDFSNDLTRLSVKTDAVSKHIIFQKTFSGATVKIEPEDTKYLDFQTLKYDVHLIKQNGDVCTVIEDKDFVIAREEHGDGT